MTHLVAYCRRLVAPVVIRAARADDGPRLRDIERLAGARFRDIGMPGVADDEPASTETLAGYAQHGRSWVAVAAADVPVGYVLVDVVDGCAHVEQVSVHPDHQGGGVGRALVERVGAWAAERGLAAVTLTTFRHVSWNAPLYRHLGFGDLAEDEIGPELRAVRDHETALGLDPAQRVCMRLDLEYRLRRAEQGDARAVADVWLRSRRAAIPAIPAPVHDDDDVRGWYASVVLPTRPTWVVERGGQVVAMMVVDGAWIDQLYVDPAHTRRGLGRRLLEVAKAFAPSELDLWTFQSNTGARRFYERHGFVSVAMTDGDNEEGAPDVRYHWPGAVATSTEG